MCQSPSLFGTEGQDQSRARSHAHRLDKGPRRRRNRLPDQIGPLVQSPTSAPQDLLYPETRPRYTR